MSKSKGNATLPSKPSTFDWNTGQRSIFWSQAGEAAANRTNKSKSGQALDIKGRALIDMNEPRKGGISLSIAPSKKAPMSKKAGI